MSVKITSNTSVWGGWGLYLVWNGAAAGTNKNPCFYTSMVYDATGSL